MRLCYAYLLYTDVINYLNLFEFNFKKVQKEGVHMENSVFKMSEKFLQEKKYRQRRLAIFLCLAFVVALTTTAALKLTGVAKNNQHTVLDCPVVIHEHTDSCYDLGGSLICGYADFAVHTHTLDCYYDDVVTCELPVIEVHEHTDACYALEKEPSCGLSEAEPAEADAAEGEANETEADEAVTEPAEAKADDSEPNETEADEIAADPDEAKADETEAGESEADEAKADEVVANSDEGETNEADANEAEADETEAPVAEANESEKDEAEANEPVSEHVHTDECYKISDTLICEKEEIILHTHTSECFKEAVFNENGTMVSLTSQLPEDAVIPDNWTRDLIPACGQLQIEEHTHGAGCRVAIELTPEEEESYANNTINSETTTEPDENAGNAVADTDSWSGTKEGEDRKDIGNDNNTKTVLEQFTWSVTINFPENENWTDFTYTDSFRQTVTGWILQANGEKTWEEDHPIHHYQILTQLNNELKNALKTQLAKAGLEKDLSYTFAFLDKDGNKVTDGKAEVVSFGIRFQRETNRKLYGKSISFEYTSLVDTKDFIDDTDYNIDSDFTLPDFTGSGNFSFHYTDDVSNETETGDVSVQTLWQEFNGDPMTEGMPDHADMILKQYAFKGGLCLSEKPEDAKEWCALTINLLQSAAEDKHNVPLKSLNEKTLGTNTATVWIPKNSQVQLASGNQDPTWSYTFNVGAVSSYRLNIPIENDINSVYVIVDGKAPAGFTPSGDFTAYGDAITLNGVDDDWSYTWEALPMDDGDDTQYIYTVEQLDDHDGYTTTVDDNGEGEFTVTNRRDVELGTITVDMVWLDEDGFPMTIIPDSVDVYLQKKVPNANPEDGEEGEWLIIEGSRRTLPNDNGEWTASWTGLDDGEYRVIEEMVEGFTPSYSYLYYDSDGNEHTSLDDLPCNSGFATITNTQHLAGDGEIVIIKIWEYEDGTPDTDHPDSVTVTVKRARRSPDNSDEPTTSETETTKPDTPEESTSKPGTTEPTTSETDTTKPGTTEPTTSETGTTKPNSNEESTTKPGDNKESTTKPGDTEESTTKPTDSDEGTTKHGDSDKNTTKPGAPDKNTTKKNSSDKNTTKPDSSETDTPYTGDNSNLQWYIIAAVISGVLLLVLITYGINHPDRRKRKEIEEGIDE